MTEQFVDAVASSAGGVVTVAVTYPVEIVKNKIAMQSNDSDGSSQSSGNAGALNVARDIYAKGGVLGFYDGVTVSAVENAIEKFLYFYSYTLLRRKIRELWQAPAMAVDLAAGCLAEIAHLPVTIPFDTLLIKIVANPSTGASTIIRNVLKEKGFSGMYAGTAPSILLSLKPAIQLVIFEVLKARVLLARTAPGAGDTVAILSAGTAFLFGAVARALSTLMVFPYMRAKVMLKTMSKDSAAGHSNPFVRMHFALWQEVQTQGPKGLYNGLPQELVRGVTSAAVLMAVRERLTLFIKQFLSREL